jgi:class 3 adenylate cyclase
VDVRGLGLIGCRLLALYFALWALAGLSSLLAQGWLQGLAARSEWLATLPQHAGVGIDLLAAVGLWFAARPLSGRWAAVMSSGTTRRRPLEGDLSVALVRVAAGLLIVAAVIRGIALGVRIGFGVETWAAAWLSALGLILECGIGALMLPLARPIAGWLGLPRPAQPIPVPRVDPENASLATLVSDLVGAAGALGVRRVTELVHTARAEAEGVARRVVRSSLDSIIAAVEQRHPDFSAATAVDGTVTIVFSDMEGFSAMTERLGDQAAHQVIKDHNRIVRRALRVHRGQEVELQGDGFLLAFPDPSEALCCVTDIQRHCAEYSRRHADAPIRVRIGVHQGTPIKEGDRFFGITVILAARIAAQAEGGEVLVSDAVRASVAGNPAFRFGTTRTAELKGLSGTHNMHVLIWAQV